MSLLIIVIAILFVIIDLSIGCYLNRRYLCICKKNVIKNFLMIRHLQEINFLLLFAYKSNKCPHCKNWTEYKLIKK